MSPRLSPERRAELRTEHEYRKAHSQLSRDALAALDDIEDLTARLAAMEEAALNMMERQEREIRDEVLTEIADIADALASQQGIKSELAKALRARMEEGNV